MQHEVRVSFLFYPTAEAAMQTASYCSPGPVGEHVVRHALLFRVAVDIASER